MADLTGNNNIKRLSPKSFEPNRMVGLGIVAALGEIDSTRDPKSSAVFSVSPRSNPIPILNSVSKVSGGKFKGDDDDDEMELSEEYTCVISHIGDYLVKKREYFDGVLANETHTRTAFWGGGDDVAVAKAASFQAADFLKSCYLCNKHLHGLDIFMYRGEKAFCSAECRCKQMVIDERKEKEKENEKEKRGLLGAMMMMTNKPSFEFSSSTPCSSPMQFLAGVAAA